MFEFIEGTIDELNPSYVVINACGIGYFVHITLNSYTSLSGRKDVRIFVHQIIREDAHLLFGFLTKRERSIFRLLISVSGIGANTARTMLSSLSSDEMEQAIISENVNAIKGIKGIGLKTAQKLIVELKDKISKKEVSSEIFGSQSNTIKMESLSALITLGFQKTIAEKAIEKIIAQDKNITVEELIKRVLKSI